MRKWSKWLIFAPAAILSLFAPSANAQSQQGLTSVAYTVSDIPPTKSDDIYPICNEEIENNINRNYNSEPLDGCPVDMFMVHMTGTIIIPQHETIEFWLASDDGGTISIGGNEWGNWGDQGCSWMESGQIDISAGSQPLDLWMYENGGGTCVMLAWNIDGQGFEIVPDEAFTTTGIPTDTTVPNTTIQETSTTWESTTTSTIQQMTTSTFAPSTTVTVTSAPTSTMPQTTTSVVWIPALTLPTSQSVVPVTMPLVEYPTTTILQEPIMTFPDPPDVVDSLPNTTFYPSQTLPFVIPTLPDVLQAVIPDILVEPPVSLPNAPETLDTVNVPSTTFPADTPKLPPLSDAQFEAVLQDLNNALPDQITAIVTTLLTTEVTSAQAVQVVSSPEVLAAISGNQATELFAAVDEQSLTVEEQTQIVEAIANAPTAVKKAFENQINIFGGKGFDSYVPVDSNVSVAVRRTIIVGTTILVAMPSPSARRKRV